MKESLQKGKTLEEALDKALAELNLTEEQIEYEVVDEGRRGFLGILPGREVWVRVRPKETKKERALEFISKICSELGLDVTIACEEEDGEPQQIFVSISGRGMGLLIGRRGQNIDALQYLTNIYTNKITEEEYVRVVIDAEGYREKRRQTLINLAKRLANNAHRNQRKIVLEPMPPHERRIIHIALREDPQIESYSEGEEPFRKVIIDVKRTQ